ncbi:hypothetical protein ACIBP6_33850 [Nonomuraea terrae]|uniref:hypothetical protein n=1 Tax=Nonomuraea terrae TaxID=2530383 RepID=UPI0037A3B8D6
MRSTKLTFAWGLAGAASLCIALGSAVPASADSGSGVTFWSGDFTGQSVTLPASTACTTLPFTAHSEFNDTDTTIRVYETTDCTGHALAYPPTDIHSFLTFDGRSFRAVG